MGKTDEHLRTIIMLKAVFCHCRDHAEPSNLPKPKIDPSKKVNRYRAGHAPRLTGIQDDEQGFVSANLSVVKSLAEGSRAKVKAAILSNSGNFSAKQRSTTEEPSDLSNVDENANSLEPNLLDSSSESDEEFDSRRQRLRRRAFETTAPVGEEPPCDGVVPPLGDKVIGVHDSNRIVAWYALCARITLVQ